MEIKYKMKQKKNESFSDRQKKIIERALALSDKLIEFYVHVRLPG